MPPKYIAIRQPNDPTEKPLLTATTRPQPGRFELWEGDDFHEFVWTPPRPSLPSPLDLQWISHQATNSILLTSPAVRRLYLKYQSARDPRRLHDDHHNILERFQRVCIAWPTTADNNSVRTQAASSGQGIYLRPGGQTSWHALLECHVYTGVNREVSLFWFLRILKSNVRLRINHTERQPAENDLIGPLSDFTILEYYREGDARAIFLFTNTESLGYVPIRDSPEAGRVLDDLRRGDPFLTSEWAVPEMGAVALAAAAVPPPPEGVSSSGVAPERVPPGQATLASAGSGEGMRAPGQEGNPIDLELLERQQEEYQAVARQREQEVTQNIARERAENQAAAARQKEEEVAQRSARAAAEREAYAIQQKQQKAFQQERDQAAEEKRIAEHQELLRRHDKAQEKARAAQAELVKREARIRQAEQADREKEEARVKDEAQCKELERRNQEAQQTKLNLQQEIAQRDYRLAQERQQIEAAMAQTALQKADPLVYFNRRMADWRQQYRARPDGSNGPIEKRMIEEFDCVRGIASVTEAIRREHGFEFAFVTQTVLQLAAKFPTANDPHLKFAGAGQEWFLPFHRGIDGNHFFLVRVLERRGNGNIECLIYDSAGGGTPNHSLIPEIRHRIANAGWFGPGNPQEYHKHMPASSFKWVQSVQQRDGSSCGPITIINAWICALGLQPGVGTTKATTSEIVMYLRETINFAIAGLMDSDTILAFLRAAGLVDINADIPANRTFRRTMVFRSSSNDQQRQCNERAVAAGYRNNGLTPLSLSSTIMLYDALVDMPNKDEWDSLPLLDVFFKVLVSTPGDTRPLPSHLTMVQTLHTHSNLLRELPDCDVAQVFTYLRLKLEELDK